MINRIPYSIFHIPYSTKSGFTLVELTVTMGIFLLMVSVVLARYRSFGVNADFSNAVENVVLSLREVQVYGAGGKEAAVMCGTPPSSFNCAYGVWFQSSTPYIIFVDKNDDNVYNGGEEIQTITLPTGVAMFTPQSPLSIVFKRPFPDAIINNDSINSATITLTKGGNSSDVTITSAGQISVQ